MIIAEARVYQTLYDVKAYIEFGKGKVSVGGYKTDFEGEEYYCISIREMEDTKEVGSSVDKNSVNYANGNEIILSFPTFNQVIAVLAAFTNKSFEVVENNWKAAQAKKDAQNDIKN